MNEYKLLNKIINNLIINCETIVIGYIVLLFLSLNIYLIMQHASFAGYFIII